jgi:hypothetical protein
VRHSLWADLPATLAERFDVVLCVGNSLVHAAGQDAMVEALTGLRRMARPGGHVVIDSRNWEKLHAERRIVRVAPRVLTRHGRGAELLRLGDTRTPARRARRPHRVRLRGRR